MPQEIVYTSVGEMKARLVEVMSQTPDSAEFPQVPGPASRPAYGHIAFEGLPNTRDLGGLATADGHTIKPGLLYRSGMLGYYATEADLATLCGTCNLRLLVDLRNDAEVSETPDPTEALPGVRYIRADIIGGAAEGITQEGNVEGDVEGKTNAFAKVAEIAEKEGPEKALAAFYPHLLLDETGVKGYGTFLRELAACESGAALWHCSLGRDRCGLASMLLESLLGVSRSDMENDFLATNIYVPLLFTQKGSASLMAFRAACDALKREFGGVEGYVTQALGITQEEIGSLRARYLQ